MCAYSVVSNSFRPHGLQPARLLCPGKNTGVGCHFSLQGIFLPQGLNLHLLQWQVESLSLSHLGIPIKYVKTLDKILEKGIYGFNVTFVEIIYTGPEVFIKIGNEKGCG